MYDPSQSPLVVPVAARLVRPEWATRVVSPSSDGLPAGRRAELMARDPYVFLHVTRSPAESDHDSDGPVPTPAEVHDANAAALARLEAAGVFSDVRPPGLYLYRLRRGDHEQIGVVADIDLAGVDDGRIGPHERIRPQRAARLADHIERIGVQSSPIAFAHRDDPAVDELVAAAASEEPLLDFTREDELAQTIWAVPGEIAGDLADRLARHRLYIVDGHHRASAGIEHWRRVGRAPGKGRVLGAMFPASQLRVDAFHRRVVDTAGLEVAELCEAIAAHGVTVRLLDAADEPLPSTPGSFGMYVGRRWHLLEVLRRHPSEFDATLLQERVLSPVLEVDEAGRAGRLEYEPGILGLRRLVERTDRHGGVAFALRPVAMDQLMAVVDRGLTLPPKSTWFAPKVRSGVFVVPRP